MQNKKAKIWTGIIFVAIFVGLMFFLLSGGNLKLIIELFNDDVTKAEVRETFNLLGLRAHITLAILSMLQVVFTFLPAEPVQVVSGIGFGLIEGGLICLAGVILGNAIIYVLYKIYGQRLTEYFKKNVEFDFESARKSKKIVLIVFILYFLPAIPYGLICIFTASLDIKYPKYFILTTLGAIPSIFIGVGLGHITITSSWILSLIIFLILIVLLVILLKNKKRLFNAMNNYIKRKEVEIKKPNRIFLALLAFGTKLIYGRKIRIKMVNNVGELNRPSIVLCNHGSFIDFIYVGRLLRKQRPNFLTARLYFYNKYLRKLLTSVGCIPKSMFTNDIENAKNCIRALSQNRVLVMMPEARLSTVGNFEGIQESTYKFIKRSNVDVYIVKISGAYLACPKWGDGVRKGALVNCELNKFLSADEIKNIEIEQLKTQIDKELDYNEFNWLEKNNNIVYKCKTLAQGLENILYLCPKCGAICSLTTKGHTISCSVCGMETTIDSRYAFIDGVEFKNFSEWYFWQVDEIKKKILSNPEFKIESKVQLRHSSINGKNFTRYAGDGMCRLDKNGLLYKGSSDGEQIEKFFPLNEIYRLLFGAGEDFEIYHNKEIWYFVPEDKRSCVIWYVVSGLLKELYK